MNKKYYSLDIAKFAFTLMIAVFHLWAHYRINAKGGFIAVEFFFILSGFFLMKQYEMQTVEITPIQYTWKKIKKYYPHYIFSFLMVFSFRNIIDFGNGLSEMVKNLLRQSPEIFMLHGTILSDERTIIYNSMTWYISALLIVGYILWALLKNHKLAVVTAAPVIVFWIYAYMCYTLGITNNWRAHVFGIFNYATLRAVAGMLLGIIVYQVYSYCAFNNFKNCNKKEAGGGCLFNGSTVLIMVFIASYKWFHRASFFYIVCFVIGILFLVVGEDSVRQKLPKLVVNLANWMGGISYAIYLNHYLVYYVIRRYFAKEYHHWIIPVYLGILIIYSILTTRLVKCIENFLKQIQGLWIKNAKK